MTAIDHLMSLLGTQREVLQRLLDLVREERACLLSSKLERLEAIIEEQTTLLAQQGACATRIVRTLDTLTNQLQVTGRASLANIAPHLPSPAAEQAGRYYRELTALADDLQQEGRVNWHLAQQALTYVDFTLKLIGRAKSGPLPYTPDMQHAKVALRLLVDNHA